MGHNNTGTGRNKSEADATGSRLDRGGTGRDAGANRYRIPDGASRDVTTSRRAFLGSVATVVAGGIATSATASASTLREPSYVTTRGHFEISGWFFGSDVELTDGNTKYNYETAGTIPGLEDDSTDEILVWVHGWKNDLETARGNFANAQQVLGQNGYDNPVVGFTYDAETSVSEWWEATEIAERNGFKLGAFVDDFLAATGGTVRIAAHSLGGWVTVSTLRALARAGHADAVESVSLLGAAIHDEECARDGKWGPSAAQVAGQVDNYWMDGDDILQWAFSLAEGSEAVGEDGVDGTPPANWEDHEVDVPGHSGYDEAGGGVLDRVVAEF